MQACPSCKLLKCSSTIAQRVRSMQRGLHRYGMLHVCLHKVVHTVCHGLQVKTTHNRWHKTLQNHVQLMHQLLKADSQLH